MSTALVRLAAAAALFASAPLLAVTVVDVDHSTVEGDKLFDPNNAEYAPSTQQGHRLELRSEGLRLELRVTPLGAAAYAVMLSNGTAQVRQVRVSGERIVVVGWMNGSLASEVTVLDRASGRLVDTFWCYEPSLSPDGRHIAFVKFFPSHFIDQWESQYRLYDLSRDAESNRPALRDAEPSDSRGPLVDVGIALYPLVPTELDRSEIPSGQEHERTSAFGWSADSRRLGFVDAQAGVARLVMVQLPVAAPFSLSTQIAVLPELGTLCAHAPEDTKCTFLSADWVQVNAGSNQPTVTVHRTRPQKLDRELSVPSSRFVSAAP